ncbi:hypothetical protein F4781DRAFT_433906 [Annulohypoxylon bovei var. microspora]|nr:hypothetical protein F4781DRAFT_433906 [Annulohypoxylon bovei var. microspora]
MSFSMSQCGSTSNGGSHRSSTPKHSKPEKKDKSKCMYMERRKGSTKASIVYDPNYRPQHKSSGGSHHRSRSGSVLSMPRTYSMAPPRPSGMFPAQQTDGGSQFGFGGPHMGAQPPGGQPMGGHQFGGHQFGGYPPEQMAEPYEPETGEEQYPNDELESLPGMSHGPMYASSMASGPSMRGGLFPAPPAPEQVRNGDRAGGFQFSWVGAEPGGKQYLHRGAKPHRHH